MYNAGMQHSPLQDSRYGYNPKLPPMLRKPLNQIAPKRGAATEAAENRDELRKRFPHTYGLPMVEFVDGTNDAAKESINVGVILSGGQAPGGHNVIAGLFDAMQKGNQDSKLYGFLGGPSGILEDRSVVITQQLLSEYRNTGGFDMIGSGRTKMETEAQFDTCLEVCTRHNIEAIVIIGGDDSNTNAAILAEYFKEKGSSIVVVGVPKTIDGDLKNEYIETSFGFDTATKTYSELIGNIERDAASARKYWHFIRLMGRSASHIALECALKTQPNVTIISEEVEHHNRSIAQVVEEIAGVVAARAERSEDFGTVLIPEGLIEFVPEMKALIEELNALLANNEDRFSKISLASARVEWVVDSLGAQSAELFKSLPPTIQAQLLMDRDPHGNVQVSRIETESLLVDMVERRLAEMKRSGTYKGTFSALRHFFGYEGRCAFPSNFDADYCYSLGFNAFLLIAARMSGYMSIVKNLSQPADSWTAGGIPITMMFNLERRHGEMKPVIKKALVELDGKPFKTFAASRSEWAEAASFLFPGAIQYWGPDEVCNQPTKTLLLEHST